MTQAGDDMWQQADLMRVCKERGFAVQWLPDLIERGWSHNLEAFVCDAKCGVMLRAKSGEEMVDEICAVVVPRPGAGHLTLMLHRVSEECVALKRGAWLGTPYVLYFDYTPRETLL